MEVEEEVRGERRLITLPTYGKEGDGGEGGGDAAMWTEEVGREGRWRW